MATQLPAQPAAVGEYDALDLPDQWESPEDLALNERDGERACEAWESGGDFGEPWEEEPEPGEPAPSPQPTPANIIKATVETGASMSMELPEWPEPEPNTSPEQIEQLRRRGESLNAVCYGSDPFLKIDDAAPEVPIDPSRLRSFMELDRLPRRFLLACHYSGCRMGRLGFRFSSQALASYVWGLRRPRHWRQDLRRICTEAYTYAHLTVKFDLANDRYAIDLVPAFLGSLGILASKDGKLTLLKRYARHKVSVKQMAMMRDAGWSSEEISDRELRQHIRATAERWNQENSNLLRVVRHTAAGYRVIFMPALLGDAEVCRELGSLTDLLTNHRTRRKPVERGAIPRAFGSGTINCGLLDAGTQYVSFAGNYGGRGFRLDYWARQASMSETAFLDALEAASERLGLTVVGVDKADQIYELHQLRDANDALRERIGVRIYSPIGHRERWARLFAWQSGRPATGHRAAATPSVPPDLEILRGKVLAAGLRETARTCGVDGAHLSRFLKTGRGLGPQAAAEVRACMQESQNPAGAQCRNFFVGARTLKDHAIAYARMRWAVIPLKPGTREGYVKWKPWQTAIPSPEQVAQWWTWWPAAAIGVILGPISGILVVDSDSPDAYVRAVRLMGDAAKTCPRALSGSRLPGKHHFYFRCPAGMRFKANNPDYFLKLDLRGTNSLIVAPPSVHRTSGQTYAWVKGQAIWQVPLVEPPAAVLQAFQDGKTGRQAPAKEPDCERDEGEAVNPPFTHYNGRGVPRDVQAFFSGRQAGLLGWNNRVFRCARWCRDHGMNRDEAVRMILAGARPESDRDQRLAAATIDSAYKYQPKS